MQIAAGWSKSGNKYKPAKMRRPEIALFERGVAQVHRVAGDIAGFLGRFDHPGDQHVVEPGVLGGFEPLDHARQLRGLAQGAACGVGLNLDLAQVQQIAGAW